MKNFYSTIINNSSVYSKTYRQGTLDMTWSTYVRRVHVEIW